MTIALLPLVLIALAAVSGLLGRHIHFVPLPLLQVLIGAVVGLSGISALQMTLDPELFLLLFVPPLLFSDGWGLPKREAFQLRTRILLHAFVLVLVNVLLIGYFFHWLRPEIPLWAAFALGSILSPTDAVAVSAIANRIRIPRTLWHILRGEALLNDASGLVALKFSLLASVSAFSFFTATTNVLVVATAGAAIGIAIAYIYGHIRTKLSEPDGSTTVPLILLLVLLPFGAYLAAETVHASGIIAAVAAGITMTYVDPKHDDNAALRLQTENFFGLFSYVLNGVIFLLLGLQLPRVIDNGVIAADARGQTPVDLLVIVLSVTAVVMGIRFFWGWGEAAIAHTIRNVTSPPSVREAPMPGFRVLAAHTVAGIRGAVTLAAAISLPINIARNNAFAARDELILIAAGVIVLTLLIAAIFLPFLLRDIPADEENALKRERAGAVVKASEAAINAISTESSLKQSDGTTSKAVGQIANAAIDVVTQEYRERIDAEKPKSAKPNVQGENHELTKEARRVAVRAEREELHRLHASGEINEETLRLLLKPLDLIEESLRQT